MPLPIASRTINRARILRNAVQQPIAWSRRGFASPAPQSVKWKVLSRWSTFGDTWIETGTYMGDSTAVLARRAAHVYSIEPEPRLVLAAKKRFKNFTNVSILEGTSEAQLAPLLVRLAETDRLSFWLDGHFSGGETFEGAQETPILDELAAIGRPGNRELSVLVDDFRCFDPTDTRFVDYPDRGFLVNWAQTNGMWWTVEHDIFIAVSRDRLERLREIARSGSPKRNQPAL